MKIYKLLLMQVFTNYMGYDCGTVWVIIVKEGI